MIEPGGFQAYPYGGKFLSREAIIRVCWKWRRLSLSIPELWTRIVIFDKPNPKTQVSMCLKYYSFAASAGLRHYVYQNIIAKTPGLAVPRK